MCWQPMNYLRCLKINKLHHLLIWKKLICWVIFVLKNFKKIDFFFNNNKDLQFSNFDNASNQLTSSVNGGSGGKNIFQISILFENFFFYFSTQKVTLNLF